MKILIVDDYNEKITDIKRYCTVLFPNATITEKYSYQSGLKAILTSDFNLILLDMSMPTFDIKGNEKGGPKKAFAGRDILRQMKRKQIKIPTIVITQFKSFREGAVTISLEELMDQLEEFDNYKGAIHYKVSEDTWKLKIKTLITRINVKNNNC